MTTNTLQKYESPDIRVMMLESEQTAMISSIENIGPVHDDMEW